MNSLEKVLILLCWGQNKLQNKSSNYLHHLPGVRFFSPFFGIHICRSRARLPGAHHVKHTTLAWSLKWRSTRLPPVFLPQPQCWPRLCGASSMWWGSGSEKRQGRHKRDIYSFFLNQTESKQLLCRQPRVFMMKGNTKAIIHSSCRDKHPSM